MNDSLIPRLAIRAAAAAFALVLIFAIAAPAARAQPSKDDRALSIKQSAPIKELPRKGKRFALVIGVDRYADTQITTLGGASNDARLLADALIRYAGFAEEQVTLLASDQPAERQPTRGNILRRLSNLAAVVPPDGLLLISFAGHGIERGGQAFLLPSDAQVSNDVDLLEQTAINVAQIKDKVGKIGVGQVLVFLDACRNDPAGRSSVDNPLTPAYTRGFNFDTRNREIKAFATLYATEVGHRAYEYKEKRQGYFTWALIEALKGGAANERKEVTLGSLVRYLQERVPSRVLQDLGPGKEQKPFAVIEGYRADELVIATAAQKPPADPGKTTADRSVPRLDDKVEVKPREDPQGASLEGTTWTGRSPESGQFTIQFLKEGKYLYTISTGTIKGAWKQAGNYVQMAPNNGYSVMNGTLEGDVMKVEGNNLEGVKFNWILMRKTQ